MSTYPTPQTLRDTETDAETIQKFTNGPIGEENVSRLGREVSNLATIRAQALEVAAGAARMVTYLTQSALYADTTQPVPTVGQVTNDPNVALNGYYTWNGSSWLWSGLQPPSVAQVNQIAADAVDLSASPAGFWPYPWNISDTNGNFLAYVDGPAGVFRSLTDVLPGTPFMGGRHRYRVSIDDQLVFGITHAGGFESAGEPMLDPDYRMAWTQSGKVLFAQRHDGSFDLGTGMRGASRVYTRGESGSRQVFLWNDRIGELQITNDGYDNFAPELVGGNVKFLSTYGGRLGIRTLPASVDGPFSPSATRVVFELSSGQSLDVGVATVPATLVPPAPNRLLTFNHGVRRPTELNDSPIQPGEMERLIPGVANLTEPPVIQESAMCLLGPVRYPASVAVIAQTYAKGATSITALGKGSVPYANCLAAAQRVKSICTQYRRPVVCPKVSWRQGESDRAMAEGVYTSYLLQLQQDFDVDLRSIFVDQVAPVKILLDQFSSWTNYDIDYTPVPFEQLQVALDYPDRFVCAGPKYQFEHQAGGGVHMTTESSQRLGAKFAAPSVAIEAGESWYPTYAIAAARVGEIVTLTFHTPYGALVADTVSVTDPGNLGLRWLDGGDGNAVSIASVTVNGDNTVRVVLSDAPTGSQQQIGIADYAPAGSRPGPATGPRSCLRDSSPHVDLQGRPVYNWACHQRIAVIA